MLLLSSHGHCRRRAGVPSGMLVSLLAVSMTLAWASSGLCRWEVFTAADGMGASSVTDMAEDHAGHMWFVNTYNWASCYDGVSWRTYIIGRDRCANAVAVDHLGRVWLATCQGAMCYDGETWHTYTTGEHALNTVNAVLEDRSGNLWFGTSGGAVRFDGTDWTTFTRADGLGVGSVGLILEDHSGALWFAPTMPYSGVTRYDGTTWVTYTRADGLVDETPTWMFEDSHGAMWFGYLFGRGLTRYDGAAWRTFMAADGLGSDFARAAVEDDSGYVWVGTTGGVSRYDGQMWRNYTTADGLGDNGVKACLKDRSGNLWFATNGGVSCFDGAAWRVYRTTEGVGLNDIDLMMEDTSGNLWFGDFSGGASLYDGTAWRTFLPGEGPPDVALCTVAKDHEGNIWVGTYGGAVRYDGTAWRTYATADGLGNDIVMAILEDHSGVLWFGTLGGVTRYDGTTWTTLTASDGLAHNEVLAIAEDSSGAMWFGTQGGGVSRFDGATWRTYSMADGLRSNNVHGIVQDRLGAMWFGFGNSSVGVSRFDGTTWTTYTTADGLVNNNVEAIFQDSAGAIWFGTWNGVSRYDGATWQSFTVADGVGKGRVTWIMQDHTGDLWFATNGGVSRYDGERWGTETPADGLPHIFVYGAVEDDSGILWFPTAGGISQHWPDRVCPQTVISPRPPKLSASTAQPVAFAAAYRDQRGTAFSHSFDGSPWSDWSPVDFIQLVGLADGEHVLRVKARDLIGNEDPTPAVCVFEVDATPPGPAFASPGFRQPVRDSIDIMGTAADLRFKEYRVEVRGPGVPAWQPLGESQSAVVDSVLCGWNTTSLPDGEYELRLSVADTLGLVGMTAVPVIVDNHAPWADQTAPASVGATSGGDVYTTGGEVHVYFPPRSFARDTQVDIMALSETDVPDTLSNGAELVLPGYAILWGGAALEKPATLTLSCPSCGDLADGDLSDREMLTPPLPPPWPAPAVYLSGTDAVWRRLGGTLDRRAEQISLPVTEAGRYAIYMEDSGEPGRSTLSNVAVTPRAFSPRGSFASSEAAISFTLGMPGPVTVKIYNRAGRLVREVASGHPMSAGANLVRWDGCDSGANQVEDGLYLVVVEALGKKQTKTLAVVR